MQISFGSDRAIRSTAANVECRKVWSSENTRNPATSFAAQLGRFFRVDGKQNWRHLRFHNQVTACCTNPLQSFCAESGSPRKRAQMTDLKPLAFIQRSDKLDKQDNHL